MVFVSERFQSRKKNLLMYSIHTMYNKNLDISDLVDAAISIVGQAGLNHLLWNQFVVSAVPVCQPITFLQALEVTVILSISKFI